MATGNSLNDEIREQIRSLKGKPFKEKLRYFLDYYSRATVVTLIAVVVLISMIYSFVTAKDDALNVMCVNSFVREDLDLQLHAQEYLEYAQIDPQKYQMNMQTQIWIDTEIGDEMSYANLQKIIASLAAGNIDVLITSEEFINFHKDAGTFGDLSEYFPASFLEENKDKLIYIDMEGDDLGEYPAAIDISGNAILEEYGQTTYFAISGVPSNPDNAVAYFHFLTGK